MVQEWSSTAEFLDSLPLRQMIREDVLKEEHEKGREEGLEKGAVNILKTNVLSFVLLRFQPSNEQQTSLEQTLEGLGLVSLEEISRLAILAESFEVFSLATKQIYQRITSN